LIFGFSALFFNKKSKVNRTYFYCVILLIVWLNLVSATYSIGALNIKPEASSMLLIWAQRLSWTILSIFFIYAYRFIRNITKDRKYIKFDKFYTITWLALAYITTIPWMIKSASISEGLKTIEVGFLIYIWIGLAICSSAWLLYWIRKKELIFVGALLTCILNIPLIVNVFINNNDSFSELLGGYSIIFIITLTGFSLLKDKIFKYRSIISIFLIIILLILGLSQLVLYYSLINLIAFLVYLILGIVFVLFLLKQKKANKLIEQKVIKKEKEIESEKIVLNQNIKKLSNNKKILEKRVKELGRWKKLTQGREELLDELKKKVAEE